MWVTILLDDCLCSQLLDKTIKEFGIGPNPGWATGHHFLLNIVNENIELDVTGLSKDGYFTRVAWDPKTGKLIDAIKKVPVGGGVLYGNTDGNINTIINVNGGVSGISLSDDEKKIVAWGYSKVNSVSPPSGQFAKIRNNDSDSEKWVELG